MEYRSLGRSGLRLSALSLGSWVTFGTQVDDDAAVALLETARAAGVNFFDGAEAYAAGEAERILGRAFRRLGWDRDSFVVSSKVFFGAGRPDWPTQSGLSRKHVVEACEQALERLQLDHLDLYFCHRPDPLTPVGETVRAMHDLVQRGLVHYWGTSEWPAARLWEAFEFADRHHLTPPTMEQPQYNLLHRDRVEIEYHRLCRDRGLGLTTWSPLRSGVLTNKYAEGVPADSRVNVPGYEWLRDEVESPGGRREIAAVRSLAAVAERLRSSMPKLAIAWCLRNPHVSTVILGASRVAQLEENLEALELLPRLGDQEVAEIVRCLQALPRRRLLRIPGGRWLLRARHAAPAAE